MSRLVFAFFAAAAVRNAAPSVSFGDSGEFAAAAATLSIPHAPGFPLYVLLGKAFGSALPWGSWAWRLNLLSGLCAAGALALLFAAVRRAGASAAAAALGVLFLGASPLWLHTNAQAEVFALNALLAAACLWVVAQAGPAACAPRAMAALGLLLGLGSGNHHTLALIVPPLLGAAWLQGRPSSAAAARGLACFAAFGALGFCVQLFLPLRSHAGPPMDWGHPADLGRFLHVLLRRDYGSLTLTTEGTAGGRLAALLPQTRRWLSDLVSGFGSAGAALAAVGSAGLLARPGRRSEAALPLGVLLCAGPVFLWLGNPPFDVQTSYALERFNLLPWLGAAWLAAAGADMLWRLARPAVLMLALVPLLGAWRAAPSWGQRWDLAAHDYGGDLLRSLPPNAALFMDGGDDSFYTVAAALYADGRRPDLEPHDRGGLLFKNAYGADFRSLPREEKESRRRAVELESARRKPTFFATFNRAISPGGRLTLWGLLRRLEPGPSGETEAPQGRALWAVYAPRHDAALAAAHYRYRALTPFYRVMHAAAAAARGEYPAALAALRAARAEGPDVRWVPEVVAQEAQWAGWAAANASDWPRAAAAYGLAIETTPAVAEPWTNLGVALERLGRSAEARAAYERAAAAAPGSAQTRFNLGSALWRAGDYRRSASEFAAAARLEPENPLGRLWEERAAARAREMKE